MNPFTRLLTHIAEMLRTDWRSLVRIPALLLVWWQMRALLRELEAIFAQWQSLRPAPHAPPAPNATAATK